MKKTLATHTPVGIPSRRTRIRSTRLLRTSLGVLTAAAIGITTLGFSSHPAQAETLPAGPALPASASVMINEVSAAAWNGAKDENGDAKDWVELYNAGTTPADISYWGLSNKKDSTFRWVFPEKSTVPAKGYLTVWLSKKNRTTVGSALHTSFNLDNGADSLFLSMPDGSATGALIDSAAPGFTEQDKTC